MSDLQTILSAIDELSPEEIETVYRHIVQRRHVNYWLVPGENLKQIQEIMRPVHEQAKTMTDEEIDQAIDEARQK